MELRKGYSGETLFGVIAEILIITNIQELFEKIDYKLIIPTAKSIEDTQISLDHYIQGVEKIISFKIDNS